MPDKPKKAKLPSRTLHDMGTMGVLGYYCYVPVESTQSYARTIGRYALFAEIAAGGMASVHIGQLLGPVGFSRTVAIKRLHPQYARDPEFVTMFLDEARLAARIRHPNVASTLDVVATHGELFLVMEYIHGESLAQLFKAATVANKPIPHDILRTIMSGVLHGLHAAHEAKTERGEPLGIVHRDVSPQNILVGTDGIARLLDFGVAKAASRTHVTRDRHIKGKLSYMAPEQVQNQEIDRRVDIYAAAVVLWELLTGQRLFLADTESSTLARVLTSPVAPPSSVLRTVPYQLDLVVLRGIKRARDSRYPTARDMALALESSGRLATHSAVGEWVEAMAHEALAARAANVADVEQILDAPSANPSSHPPPSTKRPTFGLEPTAAALAPTSDFVEDPSVELQPAEPSGAKPKPSVEPPPNEPTSANVGTSVEVATTQPAVAANDEAVSESKRLPPSRRRTRMAAVISGAIILLGVLIGIGWNRPSKSSVPRQSAATPSAALAPVAPSSSQSGLTAPNAGSAAVTPDAPAVSSSETQDNTALASDQTTNAKLSTGTQVTVAKRPRSQSPDCDPPYTVNAAGIRHYKRKCL